MAYSWLDETIQTSDLFDGFATFCLDKRTTCSCRDCDAKRVKIMSDPKYYYWIALARVYMVEHALRFRSSFEGWPLADLISKLEKQQRAAA